MKVEDLITDNAIKIVFENTSFRAITPREVIAKYLDQVRKGYNIGHTAKMCLLELGLIKNTGVYKRYAVTELGREYLNLLEEAEKEKTFGLTNKQALLFEFVTTQHEGQKRKYTDEPYVTHLYEVAKILFIHAPITNAIEVGLCHDLFEDTECTFSILFDKLILIGYEQHEATIICLAVTELTDVFTHEDFPNWNRKQRKALETARLGKISRLAQTVKYADILHNSKSIKEFDPNFFKVFGSEKRDMLKEMNQGHQGLYMLCKNLELF